MTETDKLNCAERELKMRQRVYPHWVDAGKMSSQKAAYELECMAAIVEDYRKIVRGERLI
jgi:hypothetical protein